uniref:Uncharacterized protein n=1 Tax=Anguilla anguilla TaxID=7936 RepID=A0A0E9T8Y0_ANGAN
MKEWLERLRRSTIFRGLWITGPPCPRLARLISRLFFPPDVAGAREAHSETSQE